MQNVTFLHSRLARTWRKPHTTTDCRLPIKGQHSATEEPSNPCVGEGGILQGHMGVIQSSPKRQSRPKDGVMLLLLSYHFYSSNDVSCWDLGWTQTFDRLSPKFYMVELKSQKFRCNLRQYVRTSSIMIIFGTHILQKISYHPFIPYSLYNKRRGISLTFKSGLQRARALYTHTAIVQLCRETPDFNYSAQPAPS